MSTNNTSPEDRGMTIDEIFAQVDAEFLQEKAAEMDPDAIKMITEDYLDASARAMNARGNTQPDGTPWPTDKL